MILYTHAINNLPIPAIAYFINTINSQSSGRGRGGPNFFKVRDLFKKICTSFYANFRKKKNTSDTSCGRSQTLPWFFMKYGHFLKKVPNFDIVWPTPATPRALTVKGVYEVSYSWYGHIYGGGCIKFANSATRWVFLCSKIISNILWLFLFHGKTQMQNFNGSFVKFLHWIQNCTSLRIAQFFKLFEHHWIAFAWDTSEVFTSIFLQVLNFWVCTRIVFTKKWKSRF